MTEQAYSTEYWLRIDADDEDEPVHGPHDPWLNQPWQHIAIIALILLGVIAIGLRGGLR